MFEGVVGAGLFSVFKQPWMAGLLGAFQTSVLNIAHTADQRTLILELFVYISLLFTLLTIPFLVLLKRELGAAASSSTSARRRRTRVSAPSPVRISGRRH
jgi:hypothetical protein